ncbi:MAG: threonine/serine exporter family protein [Bacteroidales bacterium]|nr:threonine/serine exporter family protein [Bacteroidales bacterium]
MTADQEQALQLATEAGHILLENGAEISRVEETMERIAAAYGVEDESFFVLSNGIIATGQHYARAEFIPIKGTQLSRVVEVNQLSREVERRRPAGAPMLVSELASRLQAIRTAPGHPAWEIILGIALGVSAFSILFGGSLTDAAATLACGLLLGTFMAYVSPHLSRLIGNVAGGLVGGLLCILAVHLATQLLSPSAPQPLSPSATLHLPNMIIGTIIALVPGVPFTNGIRDLANEDYIAGTTRLTDAFLAFLCIALGVALAFIVDGLFAGGIMQLGAPVKDPLASAWYFQLPAAFIGTIGFSALFGAPRRYYLDCGLAGTAGWAVYLLLASAGPTHVVGAAFLGALAVAVMAHLLAVTRRCPVTVFLICGIIPLVPGGGIFWTAYYIITNQLRLAATTGFTALKVTIAIAGAIILAAALASRLQRKHIKNR